MNKILNITKSRITTPTMSKHDVVFFQSLIKRQYMLLKDMYSFHDAHPDVLDGDVVGSYDTMFRVLADLAERNIPQYLR